LIVLYLFNAFNTFVKFNDIIILSNKLYVSSAMNYFCFH